VHEACRAELSLSAASPPLVALLEEIAEHQREYPTVPVVLNLDRAVDAGNRLESNLIARLARRLDAHRLAGCESIRDPANAENFAATQT
jgi:hypothetical protein